MIVHTFKPGDYVRCVDTKDYIGILWRGGIYRVASVQDDWDGVCLVGASDTDGLAFKASRFELVTVTDGPAEPGVWLVVGIDPLPQFFENCDAATAYARSRCALVPNKRAYVASVHGVVVGVVSVDMAGPSFPSDEGGL